MKNIKLNVEYDGTNYHGFQRQEEFHGPTIQGVLEERLETVTREKVRLTAAGRTDAGVHALEQVVNFYSDTRVPLDKMPKAINSLLPYDIRVKKAEYVEDDFSARFSALGKRYCYTIFNGRIASVFHRLYSYHVPQKLNITAMQEGARLMLGRHDFRTFCAAGSPAKDFVRNLTICRVDINGDLITINCEADGFLYKMVRIISGTLIEVGKGKIEPEDMPEIITSFDRNRARVTAPPQGLCLMRVDY